MQTMFDFLSVALFLAAASLFFLRFRNEDPPLRPYVITSLSAATANWLGNSGLAIAGTAMLILGALYIVHLAGQPYRETPDP